MIAEELHVHVHVPTSKCQKTKMNLQDDGWILKDFPTSGLTVNCYLIICKEKVHYVQKYHCYMARHTHCSLQSSPHHSV